MKSLKIKFYNLDEWKDYVFSQKDDRLVDYHSKSMAYDNFESVGNAFSQFLRYKFKRSDLNIGYAYAGAPGISIGPTKEYPKIVNLQMALYKNKPTTYKEVKTIWNQILR